eukprot:Nitzschia sp. Nitz4//scaffold7_size249615//80915//83500//NITZ4_001161-RA/size249615-processed-gene-0.134-mRNA-1//1//CDS//3329558394//6649//frame0
MDLESYPGDDEDLLFRDAGMVNDFNADDVDEEDVRRMAAALAPQMTELEDVLKGISETDEDGSNAWEIAESANRSLMEEDDDMDGELQQLALSEQTLRDELQFAHDMNIMLSPTKDDEILPLSPIKHMDSPGVNLFPSTETPIKEVPPTPEAKVPEAKVPDVYTLQDHADFLKLKTERMGGWYFCDMSQYIPHSTQALEDDDNSYAKDLVKDYCLPIPFRKLKKLYSGLAFHHVAALTKSIKATPVKSPRSQPDIASATSIDSIVSTGQTTVPHEEPLPVRTVTIRVRPDVLCGAIMDAVHHAFEMLPSNCASHVLKRQGGHLRGGVYIADQSLAYVADAQLCTQKNDQMERRLIVRFYHIQDDPEAMNELSQVVRQENTPELPTDVLGEIQKDQHEANRHMKQSCSLIQRLMAAQQKGASTTLDTKQQSSWLGLRDKAFETKAAMQKSIGKHLEANFNTCPSVRDENKKASPTIRRLTLPSLSERDWSLMEVSWTLTKSIVEELDTRDCTYNTLSSLPFGQFPSLPTLDVHYCSQLRRLSRETMIANLLRAAKDLEEYTKGAEYNCAICITLLDPIFAHYAIPKVEFPKTAKSLEDYPLEYTPPQVAFPPWGNLVMEALNKIAARTPTGEIDVISAVKLVYQAFSRQDDEEQTARLGRKNTQIMERLAMLQTHQRQLIRNVSDSHVYSGKANRAAEAFYKRAQKASNAGKDGYPTGSLEPEVPLLSFRISLGASTSGTCYVSSKQILFVTTFIPLVGGTRSVVFDLGDVDFQVDEKAPSTLLNPFPNTMKIILRSSQAILYEFRPSLNPTRLHKLLKIVQSFIGEDKPTEFSGVVDSVDLEDAIGEIGLTETPDEGRLSI